MKIKWSTVLKYGVGVAILAFVVASNWQAKPDQPGTGIRDVFERPMRVGPFILAAVCCAATVCITFVRWYLLVRAQDLPFSLRNAFRLGLVGYFFNTFLPGSVGGDLIKAAAIAREQSRRTVAVATVLIDRAVGLWALIGIVALVGGGFWLLDPTALRARPEVLFMVKSALTIFAATVLVWFLLGFLPERRAHRFAGRLEWLPKIGKILREFWLAVWLYRNRGATILLALAMSLVGHTSSVLMFFFAAQSFQPGVGLDWMPGLLDHFLLVPVGMAAQGFMPLPGGIGGGEAVFGELYVLFGFQKSAGIMGSFGQRILAWILGAFGFLVYSFMKRELPQAATTANHALPCNELSATTEGAVPAAPATPTLGR